MKIYLSKQQIGFALNEQEVGAYIGLKIFYDKMLTENQQEVLAYVNLQSIYYELTGNFKIPRKTATLIKSGLQGLIEAKIIKVKDDDGKGNYVLDLYNLKIKKGEPYTIMSVNEIHKILAIEYKNKLNLLRFTVNLFGTINHELLCGYASFKYLEEIFSISMSSCKTMFKLLEENKIIYVRHSFNSKREENGQIKNLSNVYGRPEHKEEINEFFSIRSRQQGYDFTNKMSTNRKGQTTRLYNKFIEGKYQCTQEELKHLIRECLVYNQQYFIKDDANSQKDISVFPQELVDECRKEIKIHIKDEKKKERKFNTKKKYTDIDVFGILKESDRRMEQNIYDDWDEESF